MPKHIVAAAATTVFAGSGADGAGAHGALELVGARAIRIFMARGVVGCMFVPGVMGTRSFAAFGAAGDQRTLDPGRRAVLAT